MEAFFSNPNFMADMDPSFPSPFNMMWLTPYPAYFMSTACIGIGVISILRPATRSLIANLLWTINSRKISNYDDSDVDDAYVMTTSARTISQGVQEIGWGAMLYTVQEMGSDLALTVCTGILGGVRVAEGMVVLWYGDNKGRNRWKALGHWIMGGFLAVWCFKRHEQAGSIPLMADLRRAGFNPPFSY